jgi:hypothetical protein
MLIGLLLAYGPISSTLSLDPSVLNNHVVHHPLNRFPTIFPILLPLAILVIPYTDLLLAVIRRTARGKSPFAPDRKHLHHRLLNMGHSHRQSVLLMYLWAALFSGAVVGLSVVRTGLVWLAVTTLAALVLLLLATIPHWRPWHDRAAKQASGAALPRAAAAVPARPAPSGVAVAPIPDDFPASGPAPFPAEDSPNGYQGGGHPPGGYVPREYQRGEYGPGAYRGEFRHEPAGDTGITEAPGHGPGRGTGPGGAGEGWSLSDLPARSRPSRR